MQSFTPSAQTYRQYALGLIPVTSLLLGVLTLTYGLDPLFFGLLALGAVVTGVIVWLYLRNEKVEAEHHQLVVHGMFGKVRTFGPDQLNRCVLALRYHQPSGYTSVVVTQLWVLNGDGKPVLQWVSSAWPLEKMRSLVNALGLPVDEITEPIHPPGLRKKYPHLMRFWQARPYLIGLLIGLGICIVAFVVIAIIVSNQ